MFTSNRSLVKVESTQLLSVLHLLDEALGWLEARQVVSRNGKGGVLGDVACSLGCTVLDVEATETTQVNTLLLIDEALLHFLHESLHYSANFLLWHTSRDGNFVYDVCFGHFLIFFFILLIYLKSVCKDTSFL